MRDNRHFRRDGRRDGEWRDGRRDGRRAREDEEREENERAGRNLHRDGVYSLGGSLGGPRLAKRRLTGRLDRLAPEIACRIDPLLLRQDAIERHVRDAPMQLPDRDVAARQHRFAGGLPLVALGFSR